MPPAPTTTSTTPLDDAATSVVLIDPGDTAGWEKARQKFLADADAASPSVRNCLNEVAGRLGDFSARSAEERTTVIGHIQGVIQAAVENLWNEMNMGDPKPPKDAEATPPPAPKDAANPPPAPASPAKAPVPPPAAAPRVAGGKFLTFFLAKEEYGFEILKVHEIISQLPITPVPRTPEHLLGVINLRGKIIPVVDLRLKLGLPPLADQTCVIIVGAQNTEVGVSVDRVSEVANIGDADIEAVPPFGAGITSEDLLGIAKTGGRVRLLLNIDKILAPEGLQGAAAVMPVTSGGGDR